MVPRPTGFFGPGGRAEDRDMVDEIAGTAEFSRPLPVDQIGSRETARDIEATAAERSSLAERLDLLTLDSLTASLRLRRLPDGLIRVSGRFAADVVQSCVVTLAPVPARCAEEFTMLFGDAPTAEIEAAAVEIDAVGEDEPEPILGGAIDLGEAVVQQLALALDPYPRAPGAAVPDEYSAESGAETTATPFATLAKLRDGN